MKKKKVSLFFALGIGLIVCSLCALLVFGVRVCMGKEQCQRVVSQIETLLPDRTTGTPGVSSLPGMPVREVDGQDYVALVDIPAFGLTLPVADRWDSKKLTTSPVRFCGSAYDNSLVIGGADYPHQFGFCDQIQDGAQVSVTDMTGARYQYVVSGVDRSKDAEAQWLQKADCDLVLFCRDTYSMEYIAVRCVSAYE